MKSSLLKRVVGLSAGATTAALLMTVMPAHAATSQNPVVFAGSETTEKLDDALVAANGGSGAFLYNVPALPTAAVSIPGSDPGGESSPGITYVAPPAGAGQVVAPNGSSAGINAVAGVTAGIPLNSVDVGRSSRDYLANLVNGGAGDPANLEFWAYAKDLVTWSSKSLQAPASLSIGQLRQIYQGTITNWNQLPGGGNGAIQRYLPQANSGTRLTFEAKVLKFNTAQGIAGVTDYKTAEENRGTAVPAADRETAIYPYSAGKWVFQNNSRNNLSLDTRDGTKLGNIYAAAGEPGAVASAGSPTGFIQTPLVYSTASGAYVLNSAVGTDTNATPGTTAEGIAARYLYHVLNPNQQIVSYAAAHNLVATGSPLAAGNNATLIRGQGFLSLATATIGDPAQPASTGQVRFFGTRNTF